MKGGETKHFEMPTALLISRARALDKWAHPENKKLKNSDISRKIRVWQERLGLLDWEIVFADNSSPDDTHAQIWVGDDYKYGELLLRSGWQQVDEQIIDQKIVHELMHVVTREMRSTFFSIKDHVGSSTYDVLDHRWKHAEEMLVERTSCALVDGWGLA